MKSKTFAGIIACFVLLNLVFASALINDIAKGSDFTKAVKTSSFIVKANANSTITMSHGDLRIPDGNGNFLSLTLSPAAVSSQSLLSGSDLRINSSLTIDSNFDLELSRKYDFPAITITAVDPLNSSITETKQVSFSFTNTFCEFGNNGSSLEITRLRDETLDNEDEWKWHPLDNIELTARIRNSGNDDLDAVVEYALYDPETKDFVDIDEDSIDVSVNEDDSEEVTIKFQVPADIGDSASSKSFRFYIKVSEDGNEEGICADKIVSDNFKEIEIKKESRDVVADSIVIPSSALCGENIELTGKVYNIGRRDESQVRVDLFNKDLGVNLNQEFKNLDIGENKRFSFSFKVPENAAEKTYSLSIVNQYDYDKNDEAYGESSDSELIQLKVEGNCIKIIPQADTITLSLQTPENEIKPGNKVSIKATVKNSGTASAVYVVTLSGYESFATLDNINPPAQTIQAGKTADFIATITLNNDAQGDKVISVKSTSSGKTIEQPASIFIQQTTSGITGSAILESIRANWVIWAVVLINIVLIIAIIIVAIRVSRA